MTIFLTNRVRGDSGHKLNAPLSPIDNRQRRGGEKNL